MIPIIISNARDDGDVLLRMWRFYIKHLRFPFLSIGLILQEGEVTFLFSLDESGRFMGYATMASDVGAVPLMPWMDEHCSPVGAAFELKHRTTYPHAPRI